MANPSFNSIDLTTDAPHNAIGPRQVRVFDETIPGANGMFRQGHGTGGRPIAVAGRISATGNTATLAMQAAYTLFRAKESTLLTGTAIADYVGTDGNTYTSCGMQSYRPAGPVEIATDPAGFKAYLPITATLRQLVP